MANGGSSLAYGGRLEKVDTALGLPSGGRLSWTVLAAADGKSASLIGRYSASPEHASEELDVHTLCVSPGRSICLRPLVHGGRLKPNRAVSILAIRLETEPSR